ncbi:hypothetical protein RYX36_005096 [Vicia faba]
MEEENTQCSRKLHGGGLLHRQSLPDDVIIEILLRLPVRSLLLLKCVCKSWKTLISDLQFAKQHLQSLTMDPSIANRRFFFGRGDGKIVSVPVKPLLENPSEPIEAVEFSMEHSLRVLGSCNGLVCLLEIYEGYVRLWNPSTKFESNKSPSLNLLFDQWTIAFYGFGYDHVNDKYKLLLDVRVVSNIGYQNVRLYTFGENSWTTIQNFPCHPARFTGKLVNGTLNWIIVRRVGDYIQTRILSFDLVKETYTEILLPQNQKHDPCMNQRPDLGVLNNCLLLLDVRHVLNCGYENVRLYTFGENPWTTIQNFPCLPVRSTRKFVINITALSLYLEIFSQIIHDNLLIGAGCCSGR